MKMQEKGRMPMNKQKIIAKALERLSHPGKPAKIKIKTLFEKIFFKYFGL